MELEIKRITKLLTSQEISQKGEEATKLLSSGINVKFDRAAGDCICGICGKEYIRHPMHDPILWLTVLCDNTLVKL